MTGDQPGPADNPRHNVSEAIGTMYLDQVLLMPLFFVLLVSLDSL